MAATTSFTSLPACREPITSALCWAHARRQFFELADIAANARRGKNAAGISPIALEAVRRIDVLFEIERGINGLSAEERLRVQHEQSAPHLTALEAWLRDERARLSSAASVARTDRLHAQTLAPVCAVHRRRSRICLTNNAAERALRGCALGRKSWPLCRFGTRGRPGRGHGHADHDSQAQRRRSAGLAR